MCRNVPVSCAILTASRCQQVLPRYRKSPQVQKSSSTTYSAVLPSTTKKSRYFLTLPASMAARAFFPGYRKSLRSLDEGLHPEPFFRPDVARDHSWDYLQEWWIIDILPAFTGGKAAHGGGFECVMGCFNAGQGSTTGNRMFQLGRKERISPSAAASSRNAGSKPLPATIASRLDLF